jgi:putative membrane protein
MISDQKYIFNNSLRMKHILSDAERTRLDNLIKDAEEKTGTQIVLATVKRSDNYAEIPWKAFALGSSVTGFAVFITDLLLPWWVTGTVILFSVAAIIGAGALLALVSLIFPFFARQFVSGNRKETEAKQYAESLFLSRELFATEGRRGILLLVCQFERQVIILPDIGVRDKLKPEVMNSIISKMTRFLNKKETGKALETGLNELIQGLDYPAQTGPVKNELSNEIIVEEGS